MFRPRKWPTLRIQTDFERSVPYSPEEGQPGRREREYSTIMGRSETPPPSDAGLNGTTRSRCPAEAGQVEVVQSWLPDILSKDHRGDCGAADDFQLAPVSRTEASNDVIDG